MAKRSGAACIPLSLCVRESRTKVEVALVTDKNLLDKRETIKRRESDRDSRAAMKTGRTR